MAPDFCNICGEGAEGGALLQCCEQACSMTVHSTCLPKGARAGLRVSLSEWRCAGCWTRLEKMHTQQKKEQKNCVRGKSGSKKAKESLRGSGKKGRSEKSLKANSVQGLAKKGGPKLTSKAKRPLERLAGDGKEDSENEKQISEKQGGKKRKGPELGCPDRSKKLKGVADLYPPINPDTVCRVCQKPEPDDCMLLCENVECGETSHTFCCTPRLKSVPKGAWYCQKCVLERETEKRTQRGNEVERRLQKRRRFHRAKSSGEEKEHIMGLDGKESDSGSSIHPDAECDICGSPEEESVMLLCSTRECESRQHTFCCKPPLKKVPSGDWFCPQCTASQKEEGSVLLDGNRCLHEPRGKRQKQCANPRARAGQYCREHTDFQETPLKKVAEPTTGSQKPSETQIEEPAEADYDSSVDPDKECDVCGSPNDSKVMLLCSGDKCKQGQHTFCCNPKLAKVPSGDWFCPDCSENDKRAKFEAVSKLVINGVRCTLLTKSGNGLRQCIAKRQPGFRRCKYHRGQKREQMKRFKERKLKKQRGEAQMGQWSEGLVDDGVRCKQYSRRDGEWVYQCTKDRMPGFKSCQHHRTKSVKQNEKVPARLSLVGSGAKFVIKRQPLRTSPRTKVNEEGFAMQAEQVREERHSASIGKRQEKASKRAAPVSKGLTKAQGTVKGKAHKARPAKRTPAAEDSPASPIPNNEVITPSGNVNRTRTAAGSPSNDGSPFDPVRLFLRDEPVTPPQQRSPLSNSPGGRNAVKTTPPESARGERLSPEAREESLLNGSEEGTKDTGGPAESALLNSEMVRKMVAEEVQKEMQKLRQTGALPLSPAGNLEGGQNMSGKEPPEREERAASPAASLQQGGSKESGRVTRVQQEEENTAQAPECSRAPPKEAELVSANNGSDERSATHAQGTESLNAESAQATFKTALPGTSSPSVQEMASGLPAQSAQGTNESVEQTAGKRKTGAELDACSQRDTVPERADSVEQTDGKRKHGAEMEPEPQSDKAQEGAASGEAEQTAWKEVLGAEVKTEPQTEAVPERAESERDFAAEQSFERSPSAENAQVGGETATAGDRANGAERRGGKTSELLDSGQGQQRKGSGATPSAAERRQSFESACLALRTTASESPRSKTPNPELDLNEPAKLDEDEHRDQSPNVSQTSAVTDLQKRKPKEEAAKSSAPVQPVNIVLEPELLVPKEEATDISQPLIRVTPQGGSPAASASVSDPGSKDARPKLEPIEELSQFWKKPRLNLH